jgi:DNA-binding transcriptional regulator YiaG
MAKPYGPNIRPDSGPVHDNAIRRFREELRLGRADFAALLNVNEHSLRVWEEGKSKPRIDATMTILKCAERNYYPMDVTDIHPPKRGS